MRHPRLWFPLVFLGVFGCDSRRPESKNVDGAAGGAPFTTGADAPGGDASLTRDASGATDLAPNTGGTGGIAAPVGTGGAPTASGGAAPAGGADTGGTTADGGYAGAAAGANGSIGGTSASGGVAGTSITGGVAGTSTGGGGGGSTAGTSGSAGSTGLENQCGLKTATSCFEPCGGDLFGNWVLEDSCFSPATTKKGVCETIIQGTPIENDLLVTGAATGELSVFGTENWSIKATMSLGCRGLASADLCSSASLLSDALLFSYTQPMSCSPNACGACDCAAPEVNGKIVFPLARALDKLQVTFLRSGPFTFPYCVTGDVLWIGGTDSDGTPKVSYKFRKRSCKGTTTPCAQRALDQCELGQGCTRGVCTDAKPGMATGCENVTGADGCLPEQGCLWNPNVCVGTADVSCDPTVCGTRAGCTWGDPVQRCTGDSDCAYRNADQCVGVGSAAGCSLHVCAPPFGTTDDSANCRLILTAADCAKAPGCVAHPRSAAAPCTGQTLCSSQTDAAICEQLFCYSQACTGTSTPCSEVPLAECAKVPGCQITW